MKLEEISINKSNLVDLGISTNKNIIVPEYINDKKWNILWHIIGIDDNAFEEDKTLESIVLPSSSELLPLKEVGASCFIKNSFLTWKLKSLTSSPQALG